VLRGESTRRFRGPHRDTPAPTADSAREAKKSTAKESISRKCAKSHRCSASPSQANRLYARDRDPFAIERLRSAPGPLRSAPEPLRSAREPLRSAPEPLRSAREPLRSASEPLRSAREPLRFAREPIRSAREPLRSACERLRFARAQSRIRSRCGRCSERDSRSPNVAVCLRICWRRSRPTRLHSRRRSRA